MARIGTRKVDRKDWPPYALVCQLATKVMAAHLGEVKLQGPSGETVEVVSYVDKMQTSRQVYRLKQRVGGWSGSPSWGAFCPDDRVLRIVGDGRHPVIAR